MFQPNVSTVILGASKEEQLKENLKSLITFKKYTSEVNLAVEGILNNKPLLSKF